MGHIPLHIPHNCPEDAKKAHPHDEQGYLVKGRLEGRLGKEQGPAGQQPRIAGYREKPQNPGSSYGPGKRLKEGEEADPRLYSGKAAVIS